MQQRAFVVVGVGMTPFVKPGSQPRDYPDMVREAGTAALANARIEYDAVEEAVVGFVGVKSLTRGRPFFIATAESSTDPDENHKTNDDPRPRRQHP